MAKLYFNYGAMGSAKSAHALITKFSYEEHGMQVWFIKPGADNRDGEDIIRSRIGIEKKATVIDVESSIIKKYRKNGSCDVIIADESQFFTPEQIDELKELADFDDVPVMCYGLRTDFQTRLFPGSRRLMEIADTIKEISTICECGGKATVNARIDPYGRIVTEGEQIMLGGNDSYVAMCHRCWRKKISEQKGQIILDDIEV